MAVQSLLTKLSAYFQKGGPALNPDVAAKLVEMDARIGVQAGVAGAGAIPTGGTTHVRLAAGSYAVTLAAPGNLDYGTLLIVESVGAGTITLALTNVSGGTASATCTWNGANQQLVLVAADTKWVVLKQNGVTLT